MCVPSGRGKFIRQKAAPVKATAQGLGDRVDAVATPAPDLASTTVTPTAGAAAPSSGGAKISGTMRFVPPGTGGADPYGPIGGDVVRGDAGTATPSAAAPRPGGDVITASGRTKKKAGDILRSGILSTVRSAGAGSTPSLFAPSAQAGSKDKLGV